MNCYFFEMQRSGYHPIGRWLSQSFDNIRHRKIKHLPLRRPWTKEGNFFIVFENHLIPKKRDEFIYEENEAHVFVVLRDPFNLFASRLTQYWVTNKLGFPSDQQRELWINHAQEYLSQKIAKGINYNMWYSDETYREKLCSHFNIPLIPRYEHVPGAGGGSSFDRQTFAGKASEMKVLHRWEQLEDDIFYGQYKEIINQEVIDLAIQIFGENFVSSIINSARWNNVT